MKAKAFAWGAALSRARSVQPRRDEQGETHLSEAIKSAVHLWEVFLIGIGIYEAAAAGPWEFGPPAEPVPRSSPVPHFCCWLSLSSEDPEGANPEPRAKALQLSLRAREVASHGLVADL